MSASLTVAVLTEASDHGVRTYSCPATELVGQRGALVLWPRSRNPIQVPFAWVYWLRFKELDSEGASREEWPAND